jgi:hypothetical protein
MDLFMDGVRRMFRRVTQDSRKHSEKKKTETRSSTFQFESIEPRVLLSGTPGPLVVSQFQATATGFTAQFNQPIDTTTLSLYDTETGALGPADVTLQGPNGAISGSLVASGDTITFVGGNGVLSAGAYTATLRSAANGIKDAGGGLLDGNADGITGDNYVHVFTVAQLPSTVVSIPDFSRGPSQAVNVGSSDGIPIVLNDGTNITSVHLSLNYDPSLLKVTQVVPGASLPSGTAVVADLSQPGVVSLSLDAPVALASGATELVRLLGEVPNTASYGKAGVLDLNSISINNGTIAALGDDGIDLVAYFGDTTGNQRYSALDGQRVLRLVVGLDTGFAPYPSINPNIIADITANNALSSLDATRILQEVVGLDRIEIPPIVPVILPALTQDTGISATDRITSNPAVSGTVSDDGTISAFKAGLDGMAVASFVNVLPDLVGNTFSFSRARLEQILGAPLADGVHTLHLQATDSSGNTPSIVDLQFTLDTVAPSISSFNLAVGSDTGVIGDNITAASLVSLTGSADAGAQLTLGNTAVLATGAGTFQIPDVVLAAGFNSFTLTGQDVAGNIRQVNLSITRQGTVTADVSLQWNQITLDAIRLLDVDPPLAARILAMEALAQYDTLAAIEGTSAYLVHQTVSGPVVLDAALAKASYTVLYALFPSLRSSFDTSLNNLLATISDGTAKTNALSLGAAVGNGVLAVRANDGSDAYVTYPGSTDIGMWRPDARMYDLADDPQWGDVTPFALSSGDEFRPDAPPALDSAEYAASVEEVRSLGGATSTARTADQTQIAQFWADGQGSYTPPGHWNLIAQQVALSSGDSLSANVRLFAQLNVALADAGIATWDAKYTYGLWRPIDAIQNADQDNNPATQVDTTWTPLLITPSFPEYVSGHSTFSMAAAQILAATFGDSTSFTIGSFTLPGVTRSYTSFTQAAQEAGRSRIYGGIHYEFTNQAGQALGRDVAAAVLARFGLSQDTQPPVIVANDIPAGTNSNVMLTGQILDNISGVASAQYQIDNNPFQSLSLDSSGNFSITTALLLNGSADGTHTITILAMDAANNVAPAFTRSFVLDTLLPSITLSSIANNATIDVTTRLTGTADATGSTIAALNYKLDAGVVRSLVFDSASGAFDETILLGNLSVGAHTLTLTAMDAAGNQTTLIRSVTLATATPLTVTNVTPSDGTGDVGSTFRPQVFFSKSIDTTTLNSNNFFATDSAGNKLAATIVPGMDGTFAWLFFTGPMPGGDTITINVDGATIHSLDGSQLLDADGNGVPGGLLQYRFTTVSLEPVPGTTITGRVVDPGPDLQPMTFDDIRRGPDGVIHTGDDVFLNPIAGAKVFILGRDSEFVLTDAQGHFTLTNVPGGDVKLVVDGRTATNSPSGVFFPEMVLDLTIEPGLPNTAMGSMGEDAKQNANETRDEIYLPRLQQSILQTVSTTQNTVIGVDATSAPDLTDEQRAQLKLVVQPGSMVDANGNPVANAQVGISTVPPELVLDMLPAGVLQHTFDITIQAPGVAAFTTPLQISFPNVFKAAPGTQMNFLSFDHTTGRLVIEGTATVSADGLTVTTDPGQGITKPGWHGLPPPEVIADFLSKLLKVADNPCVAAALGGGQLLFAVAGVAAAAVAATPLLAGTAAASVAAAVIPAIEAGAGALGFAGAVAGGLAAGDKLRNLDFSPGDGLKGIETTFQEAGDVLIRGGNDPNQRTLATIFSELGDEVAAEAIGLEQSTMRVAGATLSGISSFVKGLAIWDIAENIKKCRENPFPSSSAFGMESADSTDSIPELVAIEQFFHDAAYATAPFAQALDLIIGAKLRPLLPQDTRSYVLRAQGDDLNLLNMDGSPTLDQNGDPIIFHIADLVDDRILSDANYRISVANLFESANDRVNGLDGAARPLADSTAQALASIIQFRDEELQDGALSTVSSSTWLSVISLSSGQTVFRGKLSLSQASSIALAPLDAFRVEMYDPVNHAYGEQLLVTPVAGTRMTTTNFLGSTLSSIVLLPDISLDSDGDGISDKAELVVGTRPDLADSDSDGVSDLAELQSGTDPLGGRALPTSVVAALPLQGEAKSIVLQGSTTASQSQTAYVATGSYGLAIVDASQFRAPVVLGQLDLAGDAVDVSVDSILGIAAVATGTGGLSFINVANPNAPALLQTIAFNATQVEVIEGIAYASAGTELRAYDLLTGDKLSSFTGSASITGLAHDGSMLYTMDANHVLSAIQTDSGALTMHGTLTMPSAGNKLFVGGGVAYIAAGNGGTGGFMTANVANPDALTLLSGIDSTGVAGTAIALNGSGLAVVAGNSIFVNGGFRSVDVMNVSNPANTGNFITRLNLTQIPFDIAIGDGVAFVADGTGDLQIVNYLPVDTLAVPPVVTAISNAIDVDPVTPGIQVLEGSPIVVRASVTDDVQVRNVEFLLNGSVSRNDVGFPFDWTTTLPTIVANGSNQVTLQVRATDTGGNVGLASPIVLQLVPDTFPPTLVSSNVIEGSLVGRTFRSVVLNFSEAIDAAAFTSSAVTIIDSNNNAVTPQVIQFHQNNKQIQLTFAQQPVGAYTLRIDRSQVKDIAGNAMGTGFQDVHFTIQQFSIEWISDAGGNWNTASNWSTGLLPTATDDVFIGVTSSPVTITSGSVTVLSLISNANLTLSGGTLTLNDDSQINGTFIFSGGTLTGPGGLALFGTGNQWTGGTMSGTGHTDVVNDLAITGAATKGLSGGRILNVMGTTTWSGNTAANNNAIQFSGGTINNSGTWNDANAFDSFFDFFSGTDAFNNAGTYNKQNNTITTMEVTATSNSIVNVNAGRLRFTSGGTFSGTYNVAAGATLDFNSGTSNLNNITTAGPGTMEISGSTSFNFVNVNGGTLPTAVLISGGNLQGAGATFTGAVAWTAGNITGAGAFTMNNTFAISGATNKGLGGTRVLNLNGTTTWSGNTASNNNAIVFSGGTINNVGTWNDANPFDSYFNLFSGTDAFNNTGTYNKQNNTITTMEVTATSNSIVNVNAGRLRFTGGGTFTGNYNVAAGATLDFNSGTSNLNNITTAGAGTMEISGSTSFNFVNVNGGTLPTAVLISGGNLQGTGATFPGAVTWTAGNITGAGSFTMSNTFAISGATNKGLGGTRVLNLNGTTTWSGNSASNNNAIVFTGGTINNSGIWIDANPFDSYFNFSSGTDAFNNTGTYNKQNATITTMEVTATSNSTVNVNAGRLRFTGGGTFTGNYNMAAGATLDFNSGTSNLNNITTAGAGTMEISGSTSFNFVNVNGGTLPSAVLVSGGNLQGTGATFSGAVTWTAGNITGAGSFTMNSTFSISGATNKGLAANRILNLNGTTTWSGNTASNNNAIVFTGGTINNSGTWIDANPFDSYFNLFSGTNLFNNTGTYTKQNSTITTVEVPYANTSIVNVNAGRLKFTGGGTHTGTFNIAASGVLDFNSSTTNLTGVTIAGPGTMEVSGSASFNFVNVSSGTTLGNAAVTVSGGNLNFNQNIQINSAFTMSAGTLGGTGTVTLVGSGNQWTGGTMTGTGTTQVNANLTISGIATKGMSGGRILNTAGTTTWSGNTAANNNSIQFNSGTINNSGTWIDANTFDSFLDSFAGTNLFNNTGTFTKQNNTITLVEIPFASNFIVNVNAGRLRFTGGGTNTGTFNIAAAGVLDFNSGTSTLTDATIAGTGTVEISGSASFSTVNVSGITTIANAAVTVSGGNLNFNQNIQINAAFTMSAGTLGGTGTVTLAGTGNQWTGGTMTGAGTTQVNANLAISGAATKGMAAGRILNVTGTTTWSGNTAANNNSIQFNSGTINNSGTWIDANPFDSYLNLFSGTNLFNNTGTYTKQNSTITTVEVPYANTSIINVNAGRLKSTGGGTHTGTFNIAAGATLDFNTGTHNLNNITTSGSGTMEISGSTSFNFVNVNGGTFPTTILVSGGNLQGTGATFSGAATWTGGAMTGAGSFTFSNTLAISGATNKSLAAGRVLNLNGTTTWSGNTATNNNAIVFTGGTINNSGTWNDANGFNTLLQGFSGTNAFNNTGTYTKQGATTTTISTPFSNSGTLEVQAGILSFTGFTQTAGTTHLAGGNLAGGITFNFQGGSLTGAGSITGNVSNGALIEVGGSGAAGTLAITGNYTQTSTGTLRMEIGGLTAGTQYDRFTVTGVATLAGTLDLLLINGFDPLVGATFQILTFGSHVSTFTTVLGTSIGSGKNFSLAYNATNLTLNVV